MDSVSNEMHVQRVVLALEPEIGDQVDHETLTAIVEADFRRYDGAHFRDFVPVFVERDIRDRVRRHRRARPRGAQALT